MGTISVSLPSDGQTIDAADVNTPINTIVSEINGGLDTNNWAGGTITPSQRSGGFKVGTIGTATFATTGEKAITGVGFQPSFIQIYANFDTPAPGAARISTGVSDGTTTRSWGLAVDAPSSISSRYNSSTIVNIRNEANSSQLVVNLTSLDSDGFTLNVATANASYSAVYVAYR